MAEELDDIAAAARSSMRRSSLPQRPVISYIPTPLPAEPNWISWMVGVVTGLIVGFLIGLIFASKGTFIFLRT